MSKYCVIGRRGFIGSAIARRLGEKNVTSFPTEDTAVLFHFGSHVHPTFEKNPNYFMKQAFDSYGELLPYCEKRGIKFVYPSSALVYEKETQFSRFKKTLESMAQCYKTVTLGLRIFPVYGPDDHGTVISKWCSQMRNHLAPEVYGDGSQERDFIYIDDAVDQIISLVESPSWSSRIVDVGSGRPASFNFIVQTINDVLGTAILPKYVPRPAGYTEGYACASPLLTKVSLEQGIKKILRDMTSSEMALMDNNIGIGMKSTWQIAHSCAPNHCGRTDRCLAEPTVPDSFFKDAIK